MKQQRVKASRIVSKVVADKQANKRGAVTFSLNLKLYSEFKRLCISHKQTSSAVVEKMIEEFVESSKSR